MPTGNSKRPVQNFPEKQILKLLWRTGNQQKVGTVTDRSASSRRGEEQNREEEKWPKKSWEEGEIGGKSREEGEKET